MSHRSQFYNTGCSQVLKGSDQYVCFEDRSSLSTFIDKVIEAGTYTELTVNDATSTADHAYRLDSHCNHHNQPPHSNEC